MSPSYQYRLPNIITWIPYVLYFILAYISINFCFFFDTIQLSSLHANFFYENGFGVLLPDYLDSGHPPLNGILLSFLWKIVGKELWVGHVWILLWVLVLIRQTQCLTAIFFDKQTAPFVALALLLDATILGQSVLVSPDIILMATFVWAMVSILKEKNVSTVFAIIILSLISTRGMMCTAGLFFFQLFYLLRKQYTVRKIITQLSAFIPGVFLAFGFLGYHFWAKGWIGYHENMPWSTCFEKISSFPEFLKNILIMGFRLIDFGRLFVWILLIATLIFSLKNKKIKHPLTAQGQSILFLVISLLLIFSYSFLFYKMLTGHRYLMPLYFLISFFAFILVEKQISSKNVQIIAITMSVLLFCGNFIPYPKKMAVGWDSTLAHIPYYELRDNALKYIEENNIPKNQIVTGFCMYGEQKNIDLKDTNIYLHSYTETTNAKYFLFSNVSNIEDAIIDDLESTNWKVLKDFRKGNVVITLYQRTNNTQN